MPEPHIPCASLLAPPPEQPQQLPRCELGHPVPAQCQCCCTDYSPGLNEQERTRCEVWTRVMGYHRPVSAFNAGKRAEHAERVQFREPQRLIDYTLAPGGGSD
jgi:hypothetical protein